MMGSTLYVCMLWNRVAYKLPCNLQFVQVNILYRIGLIQLSTKPYLHCKLWQNCCQKMLGKLAYLGSLLWCYNKKDSSWMNVSLKALTWAEFLSLLVALCLTSPYCTVQQRDATTNSITTFSIRTLSITTLSKMTHRITVKMQHSA
jgi:hypothetical protein